MNFKAGKKLIIFFSVVVFAFIGFFIFEKKVNQSRSVSRIAIGDYYLDVELADSPAKREIGLAGRDFLADDFGMLFIFPEKTVPFFWMKGMKVSIDIIWIADDRIVGIEEYISPEPEISDRNLKIYKPSQNIDKVLEVRAGLSAKRGWQVGQIIEYY